MLAPAGARGKERSGTGCRATARSWATTVLAGSEGGRGGQVRDISSVRESVNPTTPQEEPPLPPTSPTFSTRWQQPCSTAPSGRRLVFGFHRSQPEPVIFQGGVSLSLLLSHSDA